MVRENLETRLGLAALLGLFVQIPATASAQASVCQNLAGKNTVVAEAQVFTTSGADIYYANVYNYNGLAGQSSDPLNLSYLPFGAAATTATTLNWLTYFVHQDDTTADCSQAEVDEVLLWSNTESSNRCPGGLLPFAGAALLINSCSPPSGTCIGNSCIVNGGKLFGFYNRPFYTFWELVIEVLDNPYVMDTDYGCWPLWRPADCAFVDF